MTVQILCTTVWISLHKNTWRGSALCYMWFFLTICLLRMPSTLPLHIMMSYKDILSPLSPLPFGNCKNHNNTSSHSSYWLWNMGQHTYSFPDLLCLLFVLKLPFLRTPRLKVFHYCRNLFRQTFITKLAIAGDITGSHFTDMGSEK